MSGAEELVSDFGVHEERMEQRMLGQGLRASAIGLGCMGMSEFYGPADERESIATIHRALDLGVAVSTYDPTGQLGQSATSIGPIVRINLGAGLDLRVQAQVL